MASMSRLLQDLDQFSRIGRGLRGTTRLAYTEDWLSAQMTAKKLLEDAGMETSLDAIGNLTGFRKGCNPELASVAVGSHLDTVLMAGISMEY